MKVVIYCEQTVFVILIFSARERFNTNATVNCLFGSYKYLPNIELERSRHNKKTNEIFLKIH